jgi:hypothetical protein
MANGSTIAVAVAGIAATALVGLAGTTASWLNAQDDRETQRALARDERSYDRRAAAYLDAIDFLHGQRDTWEEYSGALDPYKTPTAYREKIPWQRYPARRLTTRLLVFGSTQAFEAFQATQTLQANMPIVGGCCTERGQPFINATPPRQGFATRPPRKFFDAYKPFREQLSRFEAIVHREMGI